MAFGTQGLSGDKRDVVAIDLLVNSASSRLASMWIAPYDVHVRKVEVVFQADITGHNTNNIELSAKYGLVTGSANLGTLEFESGVDAEAGIPVVIYDANADTEDYASTGKPIDRDSPMGLWREMNGSGLAMPAGLMLVTYTSR